MDNNGVEIELDSFTITHDSITTSIDSIIIDDIGDCYCCREETSSRSPCICRTHMCDSCLFIYTNYNRNCTICNSELNIYLPSPTNTVTSNGYFSLSYSLDEEYYNYYEIKIKTIMTVVYSILFLFFLLVLINYLGNLGNYYLMDIPLRFSYEYFTFLLGSLYLIFMVIVTFAIGTLIFCVTNLISMISFYLTCGYIHE